MSERRPASIAIQYGMVALNNLIKYVLELLDDKKEYEAMVS